MGKKAMSKQNEIEDLGALTVKVSAIDMEGTRRPSKVNRLLAEATMRFKPYADFAAGRGPKPADFTAAMRQVTILSTGCAATVESKTESKTAPRAPAPTPDLPKDEKPKEDSACAPAVDLSTDSKGCGTSTAQSTAASPPAGSATASQPNPPAPVPVADQNSPPPPLEVRDLPRPIAS